MLHESSMVWESSSASVQCSVSVVQQVTRSPAVSVSGPGPMTEETICIGRGFSPNSNMACEPNMEWGVYRYVETIT